MSKDLGNRYFIILNKDKIIFSCLNHENKISFTKSHNLINGLNNLFEDLENFFIDNLIDIEKSLKDFIKKIYIILDTNNNLRAHLSFKYKLETKKINENKINDILNSLKYEFTKYNYDQKIIHMTIIKLLIDSKKKNLLLLKETVNDLILEVKFECLKNESVVAIKKLCSKFQISVEKILLKKHLKEYNCNLVDDFIFVADKIINEENINEVLLINKKSLKKGLFERFFDFFN
jgi:hypothetical protein